MPSRSEQKNRGDTRAFALRLALAVVLVATVSAGAQEVARAPKEMRAIRAGGESPRVDGKLDDPIWARALFVSDFVQKDPNEGQAALERSEVAIVYDDDALYIAARMYDSEPALVASQLARRDADAATDALWVNLDSYHDHRTSFGFCVGASGERMDMARANDQASGDLTWDPVWDAATRRDSLGWTAEMRIPLSQLRFPSAPVQVWGVNLRRWIQRKAETSEFGWSSQTDAGFASWFGHLHGLTDLPQPRRLELLPYATAREERISAGSANNPFNDGSRERTGAGLDLQYGVTSDLTLNATFNPDFGQVEADPAVVNLTAYETLFEERRPFFVEGASIFRFGQGGSIRIGGSDLFYSRRIGRAPQGYANSRGGYVDSPANSTIAGAAKLSGRTAGGWAIGALDAFTAREYATVQDPAGARFRDEVEPATNYALVRGRRDFRSGASTVGFIGTAVNRSLDDPRLDFLRSAAYSGGVDFTHRFDRNRYTLWGSAGFSYVAGDTLAIQLTQRSSARWFQRPDADYVDYDPSRTSLAGWTGTIGFSRDAGNWTYGFTANTMSPGFEVNDFGYQTSADRTMAAFFATRRWVRPGRVFRYSYVQALGYEGWNYGGDRVSTTLQLAAYGQLLSYWAFNGRLSLSPRTVNDGLTRGGPAGLGPANVTVSGGFGSDFRKPLVVAGGATYVRNDLGGWSISPYLQVDFRPTSTVLVSLLPSYTAARYQQQWVRSLFDSTAAATFDRRYVLAELLQRTLDLTTRLNVTLTPNLTVQLYAQPYVSTGEYSRIKELVSPRTTEYIVYGETPGSTITPYGGGYLVDPDGPGPRPELLVAPPPYPVSAWQYGYRSLRGKAVLRWEYRPGSTLFLVWTTLCSATSGSAGFDAVGDVGRLCQGPSDNVFAVKLNYWLSM